jgi:hypothetical protein
MANNERSMVKEQFWRDVVKRHSASGLGVRAFCQRERLTESSFFAWRRTLAERDNETNSVTPAKRRAPTKQPAFLPILLNDSGQQHGAITIELSGGHVLRLPASISAERLAELVAALETRALEARDAR